MQSTIITQPHNIPQKDIERFWSWVVKSDGCWVWKTHFKDTYPSFTINGKTFKASRFVYEITYGKIPPKLHVCRRCDNKRCVRPNHLFLGTHRDNTCDYSRKYRAGLLPKRVHGASPIPPLEELEIMWEQFKKDFIEADIKGIPHMMNFRYSKELMELRKKTGWLLQSPRTINS